MLLYMFPHTTTYCYICILILLQARPITDDIQTIEYRSPEVVLGAAFINFTHTNTERERQTDTQTHIHINMCVYID